VHASSSFLSFAFSWRSDTAFKRPDLPIWRLSATARFNRQLDPSYPPSIDLYVSDAQIWQVVANTCVSGDLDTAQENRRVRLMHSESGRGVNPQLAL
jgi:hypothetical protein